MANCSSILAWEIHGQRSLVGYSPWGCKESDMTECTSTHTHTHIRHETTGFQQDGSLLFIHVTQSIEISGPVPPWIGSLIFLLYHSSYILKVTTRLQNGQ